ncbi:MAG: hypothetical protein ACM3OC_01845, partial [Deltaproteobacteria bacterium]
MESAKHKPQYLLNKEGDFVITDYNYSKPLANFFPGIAGKYGIPMWVFYVNRGQAVCSFGTDGKDGAILEFHAANKAWQTASLLGFRTFIKGRRNGKEFFYEPFHNGLANRPYRIQNSLSMSCCDLSLRESNASLGLEVNVNYFSIPQDSFAALARIVRIKNTGRQKLRLELLDGLPQIVPYAENNWCLKEMSRTIEAWMRVENLENGIPVYKLAVDPGDRPQVVHIEKGNFYLGFTQEGKKSRVLKPIVDPDCIFGQITDFSAPRNFLSASWPKYTQSQQTGSRTPCGFLDLSIVLEPGEEKAINTVVGTVRKMELLPEIASRILQPAYLKDKAQENRRLINELGERCATASSSSTFDLYCRQTFLDNILRGGTPLVFSDGKGKKVFYLYSRKHGDLERDYNRFQIQDTYFSQGNGNYRDINQNRRCDVWFEPRIGDFNIGLFLNLIQTDGYNPLVVKGTRFVLSSSEEFAGRVKDMLPEKQFSGLIAFLEKPFTPGEVIFYLEENGIKLPVTHDRFLDLLLPLCEEHGEAEHGEGYWIDHWHYNLDLLENYLAIYPEKLAQTLTGARSLTFFDNDAVIAPRSSKYVLLDGLPRQLHSVVHDAEKRDLINGRRWRKHTVRSEYGKGAIYTTTLLVKLLCVFTNKYASLDPFGTGIEMEADKPNWFDALNGLPALFGSSSCELFELKRLAVFVRDALRSAGVREAALPEEIAAFFSSLEQLTGEYLEGRTDDFGFWQKSGPVKEEYRLKTRMGLSGTETNVPVETLVEGIEKALKRIDAGLRKAYDRSKGIYCAYFINEVTAYDTLPGNHIRPTRFRQKRLPFFLEGQVHALRTCHDPSSARRLHASVRKSDLFDRKLKMYKVTAPLASMPEEIGRCRVFAPGWLENESIWLHMEYKYMLELLKQGLYEEFYDDFRQVLIPFQKAEVYGRSVLENSSFLVSSAFPYTALHGNGFVARLSGSTAEFVQMWLIMNAGQKPFYLNEKGKLALSLEPVLPSWLFTKKEKTYSFRFLGTAGVVYRNPSLKDTFGPGAARVRKYTLTDNSGKTTVVESRVIPTALAMKV